ncbi:MAG TPA: bifunctional phosphoglucose/phosphomannose isomerase [Candidatus Saccharimonadales bacterium]|nr:bifunctional phosphoglucose/phosphomannose isomerase [Candidatus Saccharimonadales bacterium]
MTVMLDDLKYIHSKDKEDALGVVGGQWKQLNHTFGVTFKPAAEIRNVVLGGMGGSALYALFLTSWPGLSVPFEIVRNYTLPKYVDKHTLFIASSYSGNTEETLSALAEAEKKGLQIVVIAAGGKLVEHAEQAGYPLFEVPGGIQPRMSSFYFITGVIQLLEPLGLVPKGSLEELRAAGKWVSSQITAWEATVPTEKNPAKRLALELMGKSVVVYSGPKLFPAANKWKICMNENAKNVAWCNQLPEFNHNEFIGWSSHPVTKPYAIIDLRSKLEHPRTQKRFEVTERLLSGKRPVSEVVEVQGDTLIQQLLWAVNMGDFTSLYLALLNGVDPTPVALVEKFKVELDK